MMTFVDPTRGCNFSKYYSYRFAHTYGIPILAGVSQKPDFLDRHERGAIFIARERRGDIEPEERRDRLLAVTELHLFGPPSKKVIFFQGGNFQTPTVTAPCRKRAALCPRLSLPSSRTHLVSLLFFSRHREYKHLATAGRQKFGLRTGGGVGGGFISRPLRVRR